jgi:hypothetical protein
MAQIEFAVELLAELDSDPDWPHGSPELDHGRDPADPPVASA